MKTLKMIAVMFVASLLVFNIVIACGGMSPQPAPGDFDTDVPTLPNTDGLPGPGDTTNTTPGDTTTNPGDTTNTEDDDNGVPHDCPFPGDIPNADDDENGNNGDNNGGGVDLNNLPSDLPTIPGKGNNSNDGQFVDIVL